MSWSYYKYRQPGSHARRFLRNRRRVLGEQLDSRWLLTVGDSLHAPDVEQTIAERKCVEDSAWTESLALQLPGITLRACCCTNATTSRPRHRRKISRSNNSVRTYWREWQRDFKGRDRNDQTRLSRKSATPVGRPLVRIRIVVLRELPPQFIQKRVYSPQ